MSRILINQIVVFARNEKHNMCFLYEKTANNNENKRPGGKVNYRECNAVCDVENAAVWWTSVTELHVLQPATHQHRHSYFIQRNTAIRTLLIYLLRAIARSRHYRPNAQNWSMTFTKTKSSTQRCAHQCGYFAHGQRNGSAAGRQRKS